MGLLHKLWDDTLAGPAPETGLSKLRRYHSFSPSSSSSSSSSSPSTPRFSPTTINSHVDGVPISRSITVLRTATSRNNSSGDSNSNIPSSPAASSSSGSPFSPARSKGEMKRLTSRKSTLEAEALERVEPRSPTVYDWVVITALDR